jgi:hypothetical protein
MAPNPEQETKQKQEVLQALDFDFVPSRLPKAKRTFDRAPVETQESAIKRGLSPAAQKLRSGPYPVDDYPLSAEQLAAANLLLDFSDTRSHTAKLKSIGVTTTRYNNWLRNPEFAAYLRERAESLVDNTGHEAHTALLRQVQRGNMNAIQYYNQMTGRFTPGQEQQMNVAAILVRLVEVIQRHVKDPEIIREIAAEFNGIVGSETPAPAQLNMGSPNV